MGFLSPLHAVTLSADRRAPAKIPVDAMYYAYAYPLRDSEQARMHTCAYDHALR